MCLAVYIGSEEPPVDASGRVLIDLVEYEEDLPVTRIIAGNVYFAVTRQGCGCGFRSTRKDRVCLTALVMGLAKRHRVQLYICWEGEQGQPAVESIALSPTSGIVLGYALKNHPGWEHPTLVTVDPLDA